MKRLSVSERFWSKVDKSAGQSACWPWTASKDRKGYGWFQITKTMRRAHTIAYRLTYGEAPAGHIIRHTCDNPMCCNPSHLISGTMKDNAQDASLRNRWNDRRGEKNNRAYIPKEVIIQCRSRYKPYSRKDGVQAMAREFGVNHESLRDAITGRSWRHL